MTTAHADSNEHGFARRLNVFAFFLLLLSILLDGFAPFLFDAALAAALLLAVTRKTRFTFIGHEMWFALYLLSSTISTIIGYRSDTVVETREAALLFVRTIELILLTPVMMNVMSSIERIEDMPDVYRLFIVVVALFCSVSIPYFLFSSVDDERFRLAERVGGTLACVASLAAVLFPLRFALPMLVSCFVLVAASGSRAAFVACVVGSALSLVITELRGGRRIARIALILATAFVISIILMPSHSLRGLDAVAARDIGRADEGRIHAWSVASAEWTERPLLGRGFGAVRRVFYEGDWIRLLHQSGAIGLVFASLGVAAIVSFLADQRCVISSGLLGTVTVLVLRSCFGSPMLRASDVGILLIGVVIIRVTKKVNKSKPGTARSRGSR